MSLRRIIDDPVLSGVLEIDQQDVPLWNKFQHSAEYARCLSRHNDTAQNAWDMWCRLNTESTISLAGNALWQAASDAAKARQHDINQTWLQYREMYRR